MKVSFQQRGIEFRIALFVYFGLSVDSLQKKIRQNANAIVIHSNLSKSVSPGFNKNIKYNKIAGTYERQDTIVFGS